MKTSRYIDPLTKSYVIRNGNYVRIAAVVAWVYNVLHIHKGTIPGAEKLGSTIHEITHTGPTVAQDLKAAIEDALSPGLNVRFLSYDVRAWLQGGQPVAVITITTNLSKKPIVITYRPWTT